MESVHKTFRYLNIIGFSILIIGLFYFLFLSADPEATKSDPPPPRVEEEKRIKNTSSDTDIKGKTEDRNQSERKQTDDSSLSQPSERPQNPSPELSVEKLSVSEIETLANDERFRKKVKHLIDQGKLEQKLKHYNEYLVWRQLNRWTGVSQDQFPGEVDIYSMAGQLVETSMIHQSEKTDDEQKSQKKEEQSDHALTLTFSTGIHENNEPVDPGTTFEPARMKIYACFRNESGSYSSQNIFVKWINKTTSEVLLFQQKRLLTDQKWNYIWYNPQRTWPEGTYSVQLYEIQMDGHMKLLASDTFQVEPATD